MKEIKLFLGQEIFREHVPFIITKTNSRFAFCTIMEPFFKLPYIEKKLNEEWLAEFIAIPTIIEECRRK